MNFVFSDNTVIDYQGTDSAVLHAIAILQRDMKKCFLVSEEPSNHISLKQDDSLEPERFCLNVSENLIISARDRLGFVYGLLDISERFLKIAPFWFWMDLHVEKKASIVIEEGTYFSKKPIVKYRGWFVNDEVLLIKWRIDGDYKKPWEMVFEALLRCGGNMVIPGTDKNSKKYRDLAGSMGLLITHHHAEPLGAEMFIRRYPNLEPDYFQYPELFYGLWEEAVREQKDLNVIWCLGFRGQGDCPFWFYDKGGHYDTSQKRGKLIQQIMDKQRKLVEKYVQNPVFCTNLYGEIMELYEEGCLEIPEDVIKICADNGFGKMVTRRRDNHVVRISSLPDQQMQHAGIYYHVSFYDLQAANHITMFPNSVDFMERELSEVLKRGADDFWIINCSNVRPHTYFLDAIRKMWYGESNLDEMHSQEFVGTYFAGNPLIADCYRQYPKAMPAYGNEEDEHAGEQFYTENVRLLIHSIIKRAFLLLVDSNDDLKCSSKNDSNYDSNVTPNCNPNDVPNVSATEQRVHIQEELFYREPALEWLTGNRNLREQITYYASLCEKSKGNMREFYELCERTGQSLMGDEKRLFDATIFLHASIHWHCLNGVLFFAQGCEALFDGEYQKSFLLLGDSAQEFSAANFQMRNSEYGIWKGFYKNDCFADVKHTAFMLKKLMGIVRELGDNARHDSWYREAVYAPEDRGVMTLLVEDNHMTDWELYLKINRNHKNNVKN